MIVCIGRINVDFIFATAQWPAEHEKYRAENYVCANGGSAANTAVALSRLAATLPGVGGRPITALALSKDNDIFVGCQ